MTERHGWTLLFHQCFIEQMQRLRIAVERAEARDPETAAASANVKLYRVISQLVMEAIPGDPTREEYRLGNTLGPRHRHWRRAKVGQRFRLFFRYDTKSKLIVFAWINDEQSLRSAGSRSDPYALFRKMLGRDHPPDDWVSLREAGKEDWNG